MKAGSNILRVLARFALVAICGLLLIAAGMVAWSFDYFGWHSKTRWLLHANVYKADVMSQPLGSDNGLRHQEWDGWGFGGNDTVVYLVFDPSDGLASAAKSARPGQYSGLPCEVPRVRRLERNWYTVVFYTGADWDRCT